MVNEADLHATERALRQALLEQPQAAALWNQLGIVLRQQGRGREAVAAANQAAALEPNSADFWANVGNAHFQAADWPAAIAAYREALSRDFGDVNVWNNLGSAQIKANVLDGARQSLEQGLRISPSHAGLIGNFAFLLCQLGRKQEAAAWLEQRLGIHPNVPEAWIKLGEVWQMMGE